VAAARTPRLSPWARLVVACAALVGALALILVLLRFATDEERRVTFEVRGRLAGLVLDVADGDVEVIGAGRRPQVAVTRVERFSFGHGPRLERDVRDGVVTLRSRCPTAVVGRCAVGFRVTVPDNLPVTVITDDGDVRFHDYRGSADIETDSGAVRLSAICGFQFSARTSSGPIATEAACAPQELSLRTRTGSITASVPGGRYRLDVSTAGDRHIGSGISAANDAPFTLRVLSGTGDIVVEGRQ
jgi:hypothetical protein